MGHNASKLAGSAAAREAGPGVGEDDPNPLTLPLAYLSTSLRLLARLAGRQAGRGPRIEGGGGGGYLARTNYRVTKQSVNPVRVSCQELRGCALCYGMSPAVSSPA